MASRLKQSEPTCLCSQNYFSCDKSKNGVNGQTFSYFTSGMHLILKVKCSHRLLQIQELATREEILNQHKLRIYYLPHLKESLA